MELAFLVFLWLLGKACGRAADQLREPPQPRIVININKRRRPCRKERTKCVRSMY